MERFLATKSHAAAILTIFFIFAYQPAYNIGYNALTYSTYSSLNERGMADNSL